MAAHADVGPSGLERVIACPGSVALSHGEPNESGYDAKLGTAAHELGARCLTEERDAKFFAGETIVVEDEEFVVDDEMVEAVQVYVDHVRRQPGDVLLVEQRLEIPVIDTFGTGDAVKFDRDSKTVFVTDLKFGKGVFVSGENNPQLMAYGWGAYHLFSLVEDVEFVEVTVVQPRIDNIVSQRFTVAELEAWANAVAPLVAKARALVKVHQDGGPIGEHLAPGDHCRFCPAKSKCPAVRELVVDTTGIVFDNLDAEVLEQAAESDPRGADLARVLPKLDLIEDWVRETRAAALRHMDAGGAIAGYKLVEGRRGNRAWSNADAVETLLKQKFRLPVDDIYDRKVINPTAAEKLLAKSSPRRWEQLQQHITRSAGRPTVVPIGDKRPAIERAIQYDDLSSEDN